MIPQRQPGNFCEPCHWCGCLLAAPAKRAESKKKTNEKRYFWRGKYFCIPCLPKYLEKKK